MNTVSKSKLKPKLLFYLREVEKTQEPLIVTDHQVPVLQILPFLQEESVETLFVHERGKVKYSADVWDSSLEDWGELA